MAGTQQDIANALHTAIAADTAVGGLWTLTGGRAYELEAPQDSALPHLVYFPATDAEIHTFTQESPRVEYQFDIWGARAPGLAALRPIAERLHALLDRQAITVTGWSRLTVSFFGRGVPLAEQDGYRIMMRATVHASA